MKAEEGICHQPSRRNREETAGAGVELQLQHIVR